jgi:hypothetical protein
MPSHLLFDKKSPLVSTLMKVYKHETFKFFDKPLAIGGGTYAKEAPNTVAFGAAFKDHPGNMHSPDEYLYIDDFNKDIAIYAHAIYLLGPISPVRARHKAWAVPYLEEHPEIVISSIEGSTGFLFAHPLSIWKSAREKAIS